MYADNHHDAVEAVSSAKMNGESSLSQVASQRSVAAEAKFAPGREKTANFRFYSSLSSAKDLPEFRARLLAAVEQMGFDECFFGPVGVDDAKCIFTGPAEMCEVYASEDYAKYDLVARHAESQTSPIFLSTIADYIERSPLYLESNVKFLDFCKMAADYGYLDSYSIPYVTPMNVNCLFTVARKNASAEQLQSLVEKRKPLLYLLGDLVSNLAIARYATYFFGPKAFSRRAGVTPKQLTLLNKVAKNNVTLRGAAEQMHISLDTANKHIAAIKAALGAKTQAAAVYRAVVAGLIEVDSDEWE